MKNLDDFVSKEKRNPVNISCSCPKCSSLDCNLYKAEQRDTFDATCNSCGHKFIVKLPGLGDVL